MLCACERASYALSALSKKTEQESVGGDIVVINRER